MIETNRLFVGRIWVIQDYKGKDNAGNRIFGASAIDNKFRIFCLIQHQIGVSKMEEFKDIESGLCYPIDDSQIGIQKFFVNTRDIKSIREIFPTVNFPLKMSKRQLLSICEIFNNYQCSVYNQNKEKREEIRKNSINEITTKALKKKTNKN